MDHGAVWWIDDMHLNHLTDTKPDERPRNCAVEGPEIVSDTIGQLPKLFFGD